VDCTSLPEDVSTQDRRSRWPLWKHRQTRGRSSEVFPEPPLNNLKGVRLRLPQNLTNPKIFNFSKNTIGVH
jgi:hypothetical protein